MRGVALHTRWGRVVCRVMRVATTDAVTLRVLVPLSSAALVVGFCPAAGSVFWSSWIGLTPELGSVQGGVWGFSPWLALGFLLVLTVVTAASIRLPLIVFSYICRHCDCMANATVLCFHDCNDRMSESVKPCIFVLTVDMFYIFIVCVAVSIRAKNATW